MMVNLERAEPGDVAAANELLNRARRQIPCRAPAGALWVGYAVADVGLRIELRSWDQLQAELAGDARALEELARCRREAPRHAPHEPVLLINRHPAGHRRLALGMLVASTVGRAQA